MGTVSKIIGVTGNGMDVSPEGFACTVQAPYPPILGNKFALPYRAYFLNGASNDMLVNGTSTSIDFSINSDSKKDVYINSINVIIADGGATLNKFGNIAALSNGIQIIWSTQDYGDVFIHDGIKTNLDFMRLAGGNPSVGTGANAFKADLSGGGADAYIPQIDFSDMFGMPWGMPLRKGSNDKLIFRIRDNVQGLDQLDAIAYGIRV